MKGKRVANENLILEGSNFGSSGGNSFIYDGGIVEWVLEHKDNDACAGWNVKGIDLSKYKKIRIELAPESSKLPYEIRMTQGDNDNYCHIGFNLVSPTVLEANFDGSGANWSWPDGAKWDSSKGINEIHIRLSKAVKDQKTIVKSVTLLAEDDSTPQPETLILNGAKLGSRRYDSWIGEDFVINWEKAQCPQCGWRVEKLEGEILEIKVSSTDVPLRLRIWAAENNNDNSWDDDGSHVFRINLKTKKQISAKGNQKAPAWQNITKGLDFSQGGEIWIEPANGVFKDGKKTVVEYIKVE